MKDLTPRSLARVKRAGCKLGRPEVSLKKRAEDLRLVKGGMKIRSAARRVGVSYQSVLNWKKAG